MKILRKILETLDSKIKKNKLFQMRKYLCKWFLYKQLNSNFSKEYFDSFLVLLAKFFKRHKQMQQKEFFNKINHRSIYKRKKTKLSLNDQQLCLEKYLLFKEKYETILKIRSLNKIKSFVKYNSEIQFFCKKVFEILNKERIKKTFDALKRISKLTNKINYFQNIMRYLLLKHKAFSFYKMFSFQKCLTAKKKNYAILDVLHWMYIRTIFIAFQNISETSRAKQVFIKLYI